MKCNLLAHYWILHIYVTFLPVWLFVYSKISTVLCTPNHDYDKKILLKKTHSISHSKSRLKPEYYTLSDGLCCFVCLLFFNCPPPPHHLFLLIFSLSFLSFLSLSHRRQRFEGRSGWGREGMVCTEQPNQMSSFTHLLWVQNHGRSPVVRCF